MVPAGIHYITKFELLLEEFKYYVFGILFKRLGFFFYMDILKGIVLPGANLCRFFLSYGIFFLYIFDARWMLFVGIKANYIWSWLSVS